jgi:anti-anti-sigma factor
LFNVELSTPEFAGRGVVTLRGGLDLAHAPGAASHLTTAVAVYGPWVVVDMAGLDYICSAGLGVLVHVLKRTRGQGGDLPLAAPQGVVRKVLTVTGLISVFTVYPSVERALRGGEEARRLAGSRAGGGVT